MPVGSYQEERWRRARKESVRRLRRFEDLGLRCQQTREQQVAETLEKRRELRRKQDECMRKPWKRPSTPKKEILKRGDGARRRRAALQRSIEKAANELGHQAPGAWYKPVAEANCRVRQFIQQQRALRKGSDSPLQLGNQHQQPQNQIPWHDVKIAAEQRFQALMGVDVQQTDLPSMRWSAQSTESGIHCTADAAGNLQYPAHPTGLHNRHMISPPENWIAPSHSGDKEPSRTDPVPVARIEPRQDTDETPTPQQSPTPSCRNEASCRGICETECNGQADFQQPKPSPLGLAFSDLVLQSMNHARVATDQLASHQGYDERGSGKEIHTAHPVKQDAEHAQQQAELMCPSAIEGASYGHRCVNSSVENLGHSREQSENGRTRAAASPPAERSDSRSTPTSGAASIPEGHSQPCQSSCSASSFSGILGVSCVGPAPVVGPTLTTGHLQGAAIPQVENERPNSCLPAIQRKRECCSIPRVTTDVHGLPALATSSNQQLSPAGTMEHLLQRMQQLQLLHHKARQQFKVAVKNEKCDSYEDHRSELYKRGLLESGVVEHSHSEVGDGPGQQAAHRVQHDSAWACSPDMHTGAVSHQTSGVGDPEGMKKDGHPVRESRDRAKVGLTEHPHVLVHGLERSFQGAEHVGRRTLDHVSYTDRVSGQQCAGSGGNTPVLHVPTVRHSPHSSDAYDPAAYIPHRKTLKDTFPEQPYPASPGPATGSGSVRVVSLGLNSSVPERMAENTLTMVPATPEVSLQHKSSYKDVPESTHDMTLHGWVSRDPAESRLCDTVHTRRSRCLRGDSAQSRLSTKERAAQCRQQQSKIPQPLRNSVTPCADLKPLMMQQSKLPAVNWREQEFAEELSAFEREFQELDTDPEVLEMIRKKSATAKAAAPGAGRHSLRSMHNGRVRSQNQLCTATNTKVSRGKGSAGVHTRAGYGMNPGKTVHGRAEKQGSHDPGNWQISSQHPLSDSIEMSRLEQSLEHLDVRLQSSRKLKNHAAQENRGHPGRPAVARPGYARRKHVPRFTPHRGPHANDPPCHVPQSSPVPRAMATRECPNRRPEVEKWTENSERSLVRPESRLVWATDRAHAHLTAENTVLHPTVGVPSPKEAHRLWTHIITAGMVATFGTAAVGTLGGWDEMPPPKNFVGSKLEM